MADWTVILTTAAGSFATGTVGIVAARLSFRSTVAQVEAENERLREQHREDHLRNRQGTYHRYLIADRAYADALKFGTSDDVRAAWRDFRHMAYGVALFGADEARRAAEALLEAYGSVAREASQRSGGQAEAIHASMRKLLGEHQDALDELRDAALNAMRGDVQPR